MKYIWENFTDCLFEKDRSSTSCTWGKQGALRNALRRGFPQSSHFHRQTRLHHASFHAQWHIFCSQACPILYWDTFPSFPGWKLPHPWRWSSWLVEALWGWKLTGLYQRSWLGLADPLRCSRQHWDHTSKRLLGQEKVNLWMVQSTCSLTTSLPTLAMHQLVCVIRMVHSQALHPALLYAAL